MGTAPRDELVGAGPRACPSSAFSLPVTGGDQGYEHSWGDQGVGPGSSLRSGLHLRSGRGLARPARKRPFVDRLDVVDSGLPREVGKAALPQEAAHLRVAYRVVEHLAELL